MRTNRGGLVTHVEAKVAELGPTLPAPMRTPPGVRAKWRQVLIVGNRAVIAGHGSRAEDCSYGGPSGKVGSDLSLEQGYNAAKLTALAVLAGVMQATGTSPQLMGDLAEQWTASELRRMRRKGWRLVNHFRLRKGDIDHLLIGPGGAFVVETKWSSKPWTVNPPEDRVIDAVEQAERNARDVRLWARLPAVEAVVFLWGMDASQLPPVSRINTAIVVAGPHAALWRTRVAGTPLSADQVTATLQKVDKQIRQKDPYNESLTELPPSSFSMAVTAVSTLATADLGFYACAQLFRLPFALYWGAFACLALIAGARPIRNHKNGSAVRRLRDARRLSGGLLTALVDDRGDAVEALGHPGVKVAATVFETGEGVNDEPAKGVYVLQHLVRLGYVRSCALRIKHVAPLDCAASDLGAFEREHTAGLGNSDDRLIRPVRDAAGMVHGLEPCAYGWAVGSLDPRALDDLGRVFRGACDVGDQRVERFGRCLDVARDLVAG
jgi:hypothetical protein